jgi:hypothetical protein
MRGLPPAGGLDARDDVILVLTVREGGRDSIIDAIKPDEFHLLSREQLRTRWAPGTTAMHPALHGCGAQAIPVRARFRG